jgi:hypothetical protein
MDYRPFQNLIRLSMVSGYHALAKSNNAKLGAAIDCGLAVAILVTATWYVFVPTFWEAAISGTEIKGSLWLSWFPLVPEALGVTTAGVCGCYLYRGTGGWFSGKTRALFLIGWGFATVVLMDRVQTIQRFQDEQAAYLDRGVDYLGRFDQRRQELLSALSAHEKALSKILETPNIGSHIKTAADDLHARLEAELETLNNLGLSGPEKIAAIESARAHDLRAKGISPQIYIETLANRKPGPELLGSQDGSDPLIRADALVLAATMTAAAVASLNAVHQ